ncbi:MAG: creatininase family protein [Candidatus Methanomethyliaceae archaeon]|nr:creatininase family protein [Candidatus Methanomethyliaceae archaeon]
MEFEKLTGHDLERINRNLAVIPVGSLERHGDHLPLGTDTFIPQFISEKVSEVLDCLILPPVWYGSCKAMRNFLGTFDIQEEILYKYLKCIMVEANRNGIKLLVVVNGHGGNSVPIAMAAREVARETDLSVLVVDWWKDLGLEALSRFTSKGHAGEDETSAMLAVNADLVKMDLAKSYEVKYPSFKIYSKKLDDSLYKIALTGDATRADKEKGEELLKAVVADLIKIIEEAKRLIID